jgi:SH3 domain
MNERSLTPSPHRSQNLERGVFSSLSTLSLYKQNVEERKQLQTANVLVPKKSPLNKPRSPARIRPIAKKIEKSPEPQPRSPLKIQNRTKEETETKSDAEIIKLQDIIKSLNLQLAREKRIHAKLETEIKDLKNAHKLEIANLVASNEKIEKYIQNLILTNSSLTNDKEKLLEDIKKNKDSFEETKEQLKSIGSTLVSVLSIFFSNFEEDISLAGQEKLRISQKIKELVSEKFQNIIQSTNIDLNRQLSEVRSWLLVRNLPKQSEKPKKIKEEVPEISYTVEYFNEANSLGSTNEFINPILFSKGTYKEEVSFNQETKSAVALYDFEGEREEDLAFFSGDTIEILEECEGGWWIGRLHGKTGSFPYNFVQII